MMSNCVRNEGVFYTGLGVMSTDVDDGFFNMAEWSILATRIRPAFLLIVRDRWPR
jgi:hypothetical protein